MLELTLYAGPSAHGSSLRSLLQDDDHLLPPAKRGSIDDLLAHSPTPGVIVLCDGIFQTAPAVSHAELCRALDAGWQVWGVSSLGAIRAYELRFEGMRGFGYVYSQFERFDDFTDDEMCLLHFPEPPYFQVSEALVNVRHALETTRETSGISQASELKLIADLRELWFGDRTEERIRALMAGDRLIESGAADRLFAHLAHHRIKTIDLVELMTQRPWLA